MNVREIKKPTRFLWFTQALEYAIGFGLASVAAQSGTPFVPAVFATAVILNAATVKAPLSAFRVTNGHIHRLIGIGIFVVAIIAVVVVDVDISTRAMLIALAGAEGFISVRFGHGI